MRLTLKDLTELLNVSEKTVRRWIQQGSIPAYRIQGQYRFNKAEILEWATAQRITMTGNLFQEPEGVEVTGLADALTAGGIFYRVHGTDKESALSAVVEHIRLPADTDREMLLQFILAREAVSSTGIGDGIAIPHVRNPLVLNVERPIVTLCFLEKPIDFHSLDGEPVFCLFTIVAPTVRTHLYLLSRLAFALRDPDFKAAIKNQASRDDIIALCRQVESRFPGEPGGRT
ncbi:MAG: PTS sugar transporter subunit IIA [Deltaproteobacteria bacterium]|nr:PTS sugar transporter subunit IIA [Deltaproteobacteria bacterium]